MTYSLLNISVGETSGEVCRALSRGRDRDLKYFRKLENSKREKCETHTTSEQSTIWLMSLPRTVKRDIAALKADCNLAWLPTKDCHSHAVLESLASYIIHVERQSISNNSGTNLRVGLETDFTGERRLDLALVSTGTNIAISKDHLTEI